MCSFSPSPTSCWFHPECSQICVRTSCIKSEGFCIKSDSVKKVTLSTRIDFVDKIFNHWGIILILHAQSRSNRKVFRIGADWLCTAVQAVISRNLVLCKNCANQNREASVSSNTQKNFDLVSIASLQNPDKDYHPKALLQHSLWGPLGFNSRMHQQ